MLFCENCNVLCGDESCPQCGRRKLRSPSEMDYCLFTEVSSMFGEMFGGILDDEGIEHVDIPSGRGVWTVFAIKLENLKMFVRYKDIDKAKELYAHWKETVNFL